MFGRGEGQQASHTTDIYTDGQPYLKSRAGAFLLAGGLTLPGGATTAPPTPPPTTPPPASSDSTPYHFESDAQGWAASGALVTGVASSTTRAWAGSRSLAVTLSASASGTGRVFVTQPSAPAGATVSFRVWLPTGHRLTGVQPFVQQGAAGNYVWTGAWASAASLTPGAWNTVSVQVPAGAAALSQLGLELFTSGAGTAPLFVDAVAW